MLLLKFFSTFFNLKKNNLYNMVTPVYSEINDIFLFKESDYFSIRSSLPFHYYYFHNTNYTRFVAIKQQCPFRYPADDTTVEGYFYPSQQTNNPCSECMNRLTCAFLPQETLIQQKINFVPTDLNQLSIHLNQLNLKPSDDLKYLFYACLNK